MLIILIIITALFLLSLYLIFIKPHEEVKWAGPAEGPPVAPPPPPDKKLHRQLYQELAETTGQLERLQVDMTKIKEEKDSKVASFQSRIDELNTLLNKKDSEIHQREEALKEAQEEMQTKTAREKEIKDRIVEQLKSDINQKDIQISSLESKLNELNSLLSKKGLEIEQKITKIDEFNSQLNIKAEELKKSEEKRVSEEKSAEKRLKDRVESISKLQSDIENYKNEIENYKGKLLENEKRLSQLEKEIQKKTDVISKLKSKKTVSYSRAFNITRGLREKLRKKEGELRDLQKIAEENQRLRVQLSEATLDKEGAVEKKDALTFELRSKLDALDNKYMNNMEKAKSEIDFLNREVKLKDKAIEDLKASYKKEREAVKYKPPSEEKVIIKDEKLKSEYEKLRSEYNDLKSKSDWLVKLIREETEKNKKLQEELNSLKEKPAAVEETKEALIPVVEGNEDKEKEYFLKLYQDNLNKIFVDEKNIPTDYEAIKSLYLNLKQHSRMMARQLRDVIDKTYELSDEISKLKNP